MKKFVIVFWILVATNWYTSANTLANKPGISMSPISSDLPPFADKDNCYHLDKLQKTGLHLGAVIEIGLEENQSPRITSKLSSSFNAINENGTVTFKNVKSIEMPLLTRFSFPGADHFNRFGSPPYQSLVHGFCNNISIDTHNRFVNNISTKTKFSRSYHIGVNSNTINYQFNPGKIFLKLYSGNDSNVGQSLDKANNFQQSNKIVHLNYAHLYSMN
ncbi:hypothetical protein ACFL6I_18710 [candidate division KSB1 bacterium]